VGSIGEKSPASRCRRPPLVDPAGCTAPPGAATHHHPRPGRETRPDDLAGRHGPRDYHATTPAPRAPPPLAGRRSRSLCNSGRRSKRRRP